MGRSRPEFTCFFARGLDQRHEVLAFQRRRHERPVRRYGGRPRAVVEQRYIPEAVPRADAADKLAVRERHQGGALPDHVVTVAGLARVEHRLAVGEPAGPHPRRDPPELLSGQALEEREHDLAAGPL